MNIRLRAVAAAGLSIAAIAASLAVTAVSATDAWAGAVEVAKARPTAGSSSVTRDGKTTKVASTTEFQEGDVVRLESDAALLTVEFGDGASMSFVGPAVMRFGEMTPQGRRVVLASGVVSEARVLGVALEIQAPRPYDASMVLQNSVGFARVNPGDRIVFQNLGGGYAKAWHDGQPTDLAVETPWNLNVRSGVVSSGASPTPTQAAPSGSGPPPFVEKAMPHDQAKLTNGLKAIVFHPASAFTRERTQQGGLRLTFEGGDDEWGVVEIGLETTMFLAKGQSVEFDAYGNVTAFSGISHQYHPLFDALMFDEPIQDVTDASPITRRRR